MGFLLPVKCRVASACVLGATFFSLAGPGTSLADASSDVGLLGVAHRRGPARSASATDARASRRANLRYHGGPILSHSRTYSIFWEPPPFSFPFGYEAVIDQYFTDLASDSGGVENVNSVSAQYYDRNRAGRIRAHSRYRVENGGFSIETDDYPAAGCPIQTSLGYTYCLKDAQLRRKIAEVRRRTGINAQYFIFLPEGVDTCFGRGFCSHNVFCAYHSAFKLGRRWLTYANHPYAHVAGPYGTCITGKQPNGNDADDTINVVSHEHNEIITDPLGNAWFDRNGFENGDKCSFIFGDPLTSGGDYNQLISGNHYYLQEEWSNRTRSCRQRR